MTTVGKLLVLVAIALGHLFAYINTLPNWDNTGVLAFGIAIACAIFSFAYPRRPWLWALCIGIWLPIHNILHNNGYGSLIALVFAFAGAYLGMLARRGVSSASHRE